MANTPMRSFRLGDDLWEWLDEKAKKEGTDISKIMRKMIIDLKDGKYQLKEVKND